MYKIFFFIFIFYPFCLEAGISQKGLLEIKSKLFPDLETGVIETKHGDENYYMTLMPRV